MKCHLMKCSQSKNVPEHFTDMKPNKRLMSRHTQKPTGVKGQKAWSKMILLKELLKEIQRQEEVARFV